MVAACDSQLCDDVVEGHDENGRLPRPAMHVRNIANAGQGEKTAKLFGDELASKRTPYIIVNTRGRK